MNTGNNKNNMDSIIFNQVINFINPGITTLVSTIIIGDYISIDDGFELIQFRVGYILNMDGGIYLDNLLFLFGDIMGCMDILLYWTY